MRPRRPPVWLRGRHARRSACRAKGWLHSPGGDRRWLRPSPRSTSPGTASTSPGIPRSRRSRASRPAAWSPSTASMRAAGRSRPGSTVDDLAQLDFSRVDQVNGPIAVEGAEAGDTLQIDLLDFRPADWGWTAAIPGFGLLADDFPDPVLRITQPPRGRRAEPSSCRASACRSSRSVARSAWRRSMGRARRSRPMSTAATWTPGT